MTISITFDVEKNAKTGDYLGVKKGIPRIAELLKKHKIRGVFYVTCDCLKKYPKIFRDLKKKGYELGLHGYEHERFDILNRKKKEETIKKAAACYKKILKSKPESFRAPQFSADFELLEILQEQGFKYDSSFIQMPIFQAIFFPSRIANYVKMYRLKRKIKKIKITEKPVSSFILPISMFSLRILPFWLFMTLVKMSMLFKKDLIFLAHSYELNDKKTLINFERFLDEVKKMIGAD